MVVQTHKMELHMDGDLFSILDWANSTLKSNPSDVEYILSTRDMSDLIKIFYAKVSFRDPEMAKEHVRQCELLGDSIHRFNSSRIIPHGHFLAISPNGS